MLGDLLVRRAQLSFLKSQLDVLYWKPGDTSAFTNLHGTVKQCLQPAGSAAEAPKAQCLPDRL